MASQQVAQPARRRFFTAMFGGFTDAVSQAVAQVSPDDAKTSEPGPSIDIAPMPQLRRRNAPPSEIPDVRCI